MKRFSSCSTVRSWCFPRATESSPYRRSWRDGTDPVTKAPVLAHSSELHFEAASPPVVGAELPLVASALSLQQTFDRDLSKLRVGDGFTRTLTLHATDTDPVVFPELSLADTPGLTGYPTGPRVSANTERGQFQANLVLRTTYVVDRVGRTGWPESRCAGSNRARDVTSMRPCPSSRFGADRTHHSASNAWVRPVAPRSPPRSAAWACWGYSPLQSYDGYAEDPVAWNGPYENVRANAEFLMRLCELLGKAPRCSACSRSTRGSRCASRRRWIARSRRSRTARKRLATPALPWKNPCFETGTRLHPAFPLCIYCAAHGRPWGTHGPRLQSNA